MKDLNNVEMKNEELDNLRKQLDEIDKSIATLFEQRMIVIEKVTAIKQKYSLPIYDPIREQQMLKKNSKYIQNPKYVEPYKELLTKFLEISKLYQVSKRCYKK